jgi:protein-L-isoaspartate(D-aspartate) O-methyltransferase
MADDRVVKAMKATDRRIFLPEEAKAQADIDTPISIGFDQTNSQPSTVRWMLQWLDPREGEKVLDVGSGSGWTSAMLARLVGHEGKVFAVELVPELVNLGRKNCQQADAKNVQFYRAGKVFGLPGNAPYSRILVSAAANELPHELVDQLKIGGRMVIPIRGEIWVINKGENSYLGITKHTGFVFVPLVGEAPIQ